MSRYLVWGGTGQAKVVRDALDLLGHQLIAVFDNRSIPSPFADVPLLTGAEAFDQWRGKLAEPETVYATVAIGGGKGKARLEIQAWLEARSHHPMNVIHPSASVSHSAILGPGHQVLSMAVISSHARLGAAVIVNTAASVDHDCVIGDGVHIAPGARLAGEVMVEDFAFIGTGAVVLPRIRIGAEATIGAGAVVTRDVPPRATVVGNPARLMPRNNH